MRTIGALIFPGFELLDLYGPMEMFAMLPEHYELHLVAETKGPVPSVSQIVSHGRGRLLNLAATAKIYGLE